MDIKVDPGGPLSSIGAREALGNIQAAFLYDKELEDIQVEVEILEG